MTATTTEPVFTLTLSLSEARALKSLVGSLLGQGVPTDPLRVYPDVHPRWNAVRNVTDECFDVLERALDPFEESDDE